MGIKNDKCSKIQCHQEMYIKKKKTNQYANMIKGINIDLNRVCIVRLGPMLKAMSFEPVCQCSLNLFFYLGSAVYSFFFETLQS